MAAPIVYTYNADYIYTGSQPANQSPLDPPGTWLMPAQSTWVAPPTIPAGEVAIFQNGAWALMPSPLPR